MKKGVNLVIMTSPLSPILYSLSCALGLVAVAEVSQETDLVVKSSIVGASVVASIIGSIGALYRKRGQEQQKVSGQDWVEYITSGLTWAIIIISGWILIGEWSPTMVIACALGGAMCHNIAVILKYMLPSIIKGFLKTYFKIDIEIKNTDETKKLKK